MSGQESLKIDGLVSVIKDLRSVSIKALEVSEAKEQKLFGSVKKSECVESNKSDGGLIGESTIDVAIALTNIRDIISFMEKL